MPRWLKDSVRLLFAPTASAAFGAAVGAELGVPLSPHEERVERRLGADIHRRSRPTK
jgi:hypothetical protein